jgi:hypothetical protein
VRKRCRHDARRRRAPAAQDIKDAVEACRKAMIDLTVAHKALVLNELNRWLAAEEATHIPEAARH